MPNWCRNRVTISSKTEDDSQFQELVSKFKSDRPFNSILPQPDWKNIKNEDGELPVEHLHKNNEGKVICSSWDFPKSGKNDDRWYHWANTHWGTKWDVHDIEIEDDGEWAEFQFDTAWAPAEGIFHKIKKDYPNVAISWFYDEPGCEFAGYLPN